LTRAFWKGNPKDRDGLRCTAILPLCAWQPNSTALGCLTSSPGGRGAAAAGAGFRTQALPNGNMTCAGEWHSEFEHISVPYCAVLHFFSKIVQYSLVEGCKAIYHGELSNLDVFSNRTGRIELTTPSPIHAKRKKNSNSEFNSW
jgi:hypothetical protein